MSKPAKLSAAESPTPAVWEPTPRTRIELRGFHLMHGGPRAMYLPEHEHAEIQVQTRFHPTAGAIGLEPHGNSLYAPRQPHSGGIDENWEVIVMLLDPGFLARAADEIFTRDRFEIKPFRMARSRMIEGLCYAARGEFRSAHGPGLLFLESIGHVMSGHILRQHAITSAARPIRGTFSTAELHRVDQFIDEKLAAPFAVDDLAALMKLGPQRFTEKFRLTTGMSPWQYVQTRRIRRAKTLLANRRMSLAEIGLAVGFCNQSHFTNVFRRSTGVTPAEFRKEIA